MSFLLNTDQNNQKILIDQKTTLSVGTPSSSLTITHGLGYIPSARVWYEPVPGRWYPLGQVRLNDFNSGGGVDFHGYYYLTTTQLFLEITNSLGVTQSIGIHVRIYLDG